VNPLTRYFAIAWHVALAIAVGILIYLVYRAGEDHVGSKDLKGLQDEIKAQGRIVDSWHKETTDAQAQLSKDVGIIRDAASKPQQHQWMRCAGTSQGDRVLPGPAGKAGDQLPAGGSLQSGDGSDVEGRRRDAVVAAFKERWETILATCRAEDSQWPH
jgi:hypothetical protein